jgi:hypothetical protein
VSLTGYRGLLLLDGREVPLRDAPVPGLGASTLLFFLRRKVLAGDKTKIAVWIHAVTGPKGPAFLSYFRNGSALRTSHISPGRYRIIADQVIGRLDLRFLTGFGEAEP